VGNARIDGRLVTVIARGPVINSAGFAAAITRPEGPILLDTTVLIDISRRREPSTSWVQDAIRNAAELCVSAITGAEFFAGLPPSERATWEAFLTELTHVDVTKEIAILAGTYRYDMARRGRTILIPDALIAATAIATAATLVTANIKDFPLAEIKTIRLDASSR
jgi:predicted nucleic acid-binding protein